MPNTQAQSWSNIRIQSRRTCQLPGSTRKAIRSEWRGATEIVFPNPESGNRNCCHEKERADCIRLHPLFVQPDIVALLLGCWYLTLGTTCRNFDMYYKKCALIYTYLRCSWSLHSAYTESCIQIYEELNDSFVELGDEGSPAQLKALLGELNQLHKQRSKLFGIDPMMASPEDFQKAAKKTKDVRKGSYSKQYQMQSVDCRPRLRITL